MLIRRAAGGFTLIEVMVTLAILLFGLLGLAGLIAKGQRAAYEAYQRHQAMAVANEITERIKANQSAIASAYLDATTPDNVTIALRYANGAKVGTPLGDPDTKTKWNGLAVDHSILDCSTTACQDFCVANAAVAPSSERFADDIRTCTQRLQAEYDLAIWEGQLLGVSELRTATGTTIGGIQNARGCIEVVDTVSIAGAAAPFATTLRVSVAWQGDVSTAVPTDSESSCGAGLYRNNLGSVDAATRRLISMDVNIVIPQ